MASWYFVSAQTSSFHRYTKKSGLPSNQVFSMHQDSRGYMWFGTTMGACRFDGVEFESLLNQDVISSPTVYDINEDGAGRMRFQLDATVWYLTEGTVVPHPLNHLFSENSAHQHAIELLQDDEFGVEHVTLSNRTGLRIYPDHTHEVTKDSADLIYRTVQGKLIYRPGWRSLQDNNVRFALNNGTTIDSTFDLSGNVDYKSIEIHDHYGKPYFAMGNDLLYPERDRIRHMRFDKRIISFESDPDSTLWITFKLGGVRRFDDRMNELSHPFGSLANKTITELLIDDQGGYWISSSGDGVFYYPEPSVISFPNPDASGQKSAVSLLPMSDSVLIAYSDGMLSSVDQEGRVTSSVQMMGKKIQVNQISDIPYYGLTVAHHHGAYSLTRDCIVQAEPSSGGFVFPGYTRCFVPMANGRTAAACYQFVVMEGSDHRFRAYAENMDRLALLKMTGKILTMTPLDDAVLIGGMKGLLWQRKDTLRRIPAIDDLIGDDVVTTLCAIDDDIYVGAYGNGLLLCPDGDLEHPTHLSWLKVKTITCLKNDGDSVLWVGTPDGLMKLVPPDTVPVRITEDYGLAANRIMDVLPMEEHIWLGTEEGAFRFQRNSLDFPPAPPIVHLAKVQSDKMDIPVSDRTSLTFEQNNLQVHFDVLDYRNIPDVVVNYRLEGLDKDWRTTEGREINYAAIPPGNYTLRLRSSNGRGDRSPEATWQFSVAKPFWYSWWFIGLVVALMAAGIFGTVRFFMWRTSRRLRRQNLLAHYQQQALAARMDPHFMFNSLSSLKYYITSKDHQGASKYLSKFTALMRSVLEYSRKEFIPLDRELQLITAYCELQATRVRGGLVHDIVIDSNIIPSETRIPSMVVQPLVENAIWHGLANSDRDRHLKVSVARHEDGIVLDVQDNGVGRAASSSLKGSRTIPKRSHALSLIRKRLAILTRSKKERFELIITDLYDNDAPSGTLATLHLPMIRADE